jgi:hypothetical protein
LTDRHDLIDMHRAKIRNRTVNESRPQTKTPSATAPIDHRG